MMRKRENKVCKCLILCAVAGAMLLNALDVQAGKAKETVWVITSIDTNNLSTRENQGNERYKYGKNGLLIKSSRKHDTRYTATDNTTKVAFSDEYVNTYTYKDKKLDGIERKRYHNGEESDYGCGSSKFYYDKNGNIRKIKTRFYHLLNFKPPVIYTDTTAKYIYDGNNVVEIREKSISKSGDNTYNCTKKMSYDAANRLSTFEIIDGVRPQYTHTIRYDEKGFPFVNPELRNDYSEQSGRITSIVSHNIKIPMAASTAKDIKYKKIRVDKSYLKAIEEQQKCILGQLLIPTGVNTMDSPLFLEAEY